MGKLISTTSLAENGLIKKTKKNKKKTKKKLMLEC